MPKNEKVAIVSLLDVIDMCQKFNDEEISQEEFVEWTQENIKVISYLPLTDKVMCVIDLLYEKENDTSESMEWEIAALEQEKFWGVLLRYTNIDTTDTEMEQNIINYDLVYSLMGDWILAHCLADYERTIKMFESLVNVYNIQGLLSIFESFDDSNLAKPVEDFKQKVDELLDKENMIKNISDMMK